MSEEKKSFVKKFTKKKKKDLTKEKIIIQKGN